MDYYNCIGITKLCIVLVGLNICISKKKIIGSLSEKINNREILLTTQYLNHESQQRTQTYCLWIYLHVYQPIQLAFFNT